MKKILAFFISVFCIMQGFSAVSFGAVVQSPVRNQKTFKQSQKTFKQTQKTFKQTLPKSQSQNKPQPQSQPTQQVQPQGQVTQDAVQNNNSGLIDTNKLKDDINAVLKKSFPEAEVTSFKQVPKNGTIVYECNVTYQGRNIKLYVNPQNGAISSSFDDKALFSENLTQSKINKDVKEVNNVLKQVKLDASFSDIQYNKRNKTMEGKIFYMDSNYYFKMNIVTGEIIDMRPLG